MQSIEIPSITGVILLPNCVTFPHGALPLHIFEPRYRKMLDDALSDNFMIAVGNLTSDENENLGTCTASIGTIGLIRASREQEDGRSHLILHGITRVEFLSWSSDSPYPKANIRPIANNNPPLTPNNKLLIKTLRDATSRVLTEIPRDAANRVNETLDKVNDNLAVLTDVVAQQFVSNNDVRQTLLAETDSINRAEILTRHLRALN